MQRDQDADELVIGCKTVGGMNGVKMGGDGGRVRPSKMCWRIGSRVDSQEKRDKIKETMVRIGRRRRPRCLFTIGKSSNRMSGSKKWWRVGRSAS